MSNKIWQFADEKNIIKSPYEYLKEYALRLEEDTKGLLQGMFHRYIEKRITKLSAPYTL
jgi:hypothetical protein